MRGGSNLKMGIPNGGAQGDRRPSKLELMREDYHKKILKEKEEKMVQLYEDSQMSQKKAMMRLMRGGSGEGGGGVTNGNQGAGASSVRDVFNQRRRMEASGVPAPPIDDHFKQAKGYSSPGGWSSRTGSGNSSKKFSAGRDRSQPLAPIRRPSDTRDMPQAGITPKTDRRPSGLNDDSNPFNARPKLVKHKPLPPTNGYSNNHSYQNQQQQQQPNIIDRNNNDKQMGSPSRFGFQQRHTQQKQQPPPPLQQQKQQQQQQPPPPQQQKQQQQQQPLPPQQQKQHQPLPPQHPSPGRQQNGKFRSVPVKQRENPKSNNSQQPKMTDFQKWQMEQNKAREERLKKLNDSPSKNRQGYWDDEDEEGEEHDRQNGLSDVGNGGYEYEEEDDGDDDRDDEVAKLERELLEKIEREKFELERIRREKTQAEEEEKREMEDRKKREKVERAKQKKLEEMRRKEEIQRRKEEEEDERRERQRQDKDKKEEEKRQREEEKRRREEERIGAKRDKEEQKRQATLQKHQAKESAMSNYSTGAYDDYQDETPAQSTRRSSPVPASSGLTLGEIDEMPVANADSSFYAKVATSSEAKGSVGSLARCKVCGRSFAVDRLKKHQDACSKASKPRKEFDSSKKRVEGTDAAKFAGKTRAPPKKKNNWRSQHQEFIDSLRYAKKAAQYEKDGKDLRELTPPPVTNNPDLVPCPYCNRTFNETAAQRHIPRCKDLKTKPPPVNNRRH